MKVVYSLEDLTHDCFRAVATIGNFEGIHIGHQALLRSLVARAAELAGTPTVLTFNPHPLQVLAPGNAPRQLQTLDQKLAVMADLGIRLVVVLPFDREFAQITARRFVHSILCDKVRVSEIYVGPNFAFGNRREGGFNLLKETGEERGFFVGRIHQVQFRGNRVSSTAIRQALLDGRASLARRLLGRPFALEGEVIRGQSAGAGIGVRTANLRTPNELLPRHGVYVSWLTVDRVRRMSVTNVGVRPTISGGGEGAPVSIETHLLDFDRDIYGRRVVLELLTRLREERRFSGPDALLTQIRRDIERARRYFRWMANAGIACSPGADREGGHHVA